MFYYSGLHKKQRTKINAEKYAQPKEVNRMEKRTKIITDYRQRGGDGNVDNIVGIG